MVVLIRMGRAKKLSNDTSSCTVKLRVESMVFDISTAHCVGPSLNVTVLEFRRVGVVPILYSEAPSLLLLLLFVAIRCYNE